MVCRSAAVRMTVTRHKLNGVWRSCSKRQPRTVDRNSACNAEKRPASGGRIALHNQFAPSCLASQRCMWSGVCRGLRMATAPGSSMPQP
jgi:hypothetical protein